MLTKSKLLCVQICDYHNNKAKLCFQLMQVVDMFNVESPQMIGLMQTATKLLQMKLLPKRSGNGNNLSWSSKG